METKSSKRQNGDKNPSQIMSKMQELPVAETAKWMSETSKRLKEIYERKYAKLRRAIEDAIDGR